MKKPRLTNKSQAQQGGASSSSAPLTDIATAGQPAQKGACGLIIWMSIEVDYENLDNLCLMVLPQLKQNPFVIMQIAWARGRVIGF